MGASKELQEKVGLTSLPLPLYYQISGSLRERITNGEWRPGDKLPTEEALSEQYGVSRQTVRKAKEPLVRAGFLRSVKGGGCYVASDNLWNPHPPSVENLKEFFTFALTTSFKIHDYGMTLNHETVVRHLRNDGDEYVFRIRGVRYLQGNPLSYVVYHLPTDFAARIPLEKLDRNAFIPQFERLAGIKAMEGIQSISLGRADEQAAAHLNLSLGDPVLVVETVYVDPEGRPIEYVRSQYGERLPYSIRVKR